MKICVVNEREELYVVSLFCMYVFLCFVYFSVVYDKNSVADSTNIAIIDEQMTNIFQS